MRGGKSKKGVKGDRWKGKEEERGWSRGVEVDTRTQMQAQKVSGNSLLKNLQTKYKRN